MKVPALPRRHTQAPFRVAAPFGQRREAASRTLVEAFDESEVDDELGLRRDLVDVLAAGTTRADAPRLECGGGNPHSGNDVDGVGHGRRES